MHGAHECGAESALLQCASDQIAYASGHGHAIQLPGSTVFSTAPRPVEPIMRRASTRLFAGLDFAMQRE